MSEQVQDSFNSLPLCILVLRYVDLQVLEIMELQAAPGVNGNSSEGSRDKSDKGLKPLPALIWLYILQR